MKLFPYGKFNSSGFYKNLPIINTALYTVTQQVRFGQRAKRFEVALTALSLELTTKRI